MIIFSGLSTETAHHLRAGRPDDYGNPPETGISDGDGNPCRHCLAMIEKDAPFLIVSHRPFTSKQPYAEQGPIFLHAADCAAHVEDGSLPSAFDSPRYILRGYDEDERIVYGTGAIVERDHIRDHAEKMLDLETVRFVHIRSATNTCWQGRIERA